MGSVTANDAKVRKYCQAVSDELWAVRNEAAGWWSEIASTLYPIALPGIDTQISGLRRASTREELRMTNTAQDLLKKGAAGFSTNLTSPARKWFELGTALRLQDEAQQHDVDSGLEYLASAIREVFEACGIYNQLDKLYEHLIAFGTACMLVFPRNGSGYQYVSATTLRFGTYALGIAADGMVNRVSRKFEFTVAQLAEEFGLERLPLRLLELYKRGAATTTRVTVVNLIEPNDVESVWDEVGRLCKVPADFTYRSVYWIDGDGGMSRQTDAPILAVRPLWFNPIIAPRLNMEAGDVWGRGCGIDALPAARLLAQLREDSVQMVSNMAMPPLLADVDLQGRELGLDRGDVTYWNSREGVTPTIPAIPVQQSLQGVMEQVTQQINELAETFFVTRFSVIDTLKNQPGDKTATEVNQLVRENMGLLGPVVTGLDKELLDPLVKLLVNYTVQVAKREGIPLDSLEPVIGDGPGMKVRYVGEIHQAAKAGNLTAIERAVQFAGALAQTTQDIGVLDNINSDKIVRTYCDSVGVMPSDLTSPDEMDAARSQRQAQMEQAQQMAAAQSGTQSLKQGADAVKALSESNIPQEVANGLV